MKEHKKHVQGSKKNHFAAFTLKKETVEESHRLREVQARTHSS